MTQEEITTNSIFDIALLEQLLLKPKEITRPKSVEKLIREAAKISPNEKIEYNAKFWKSLCNILTNKAVDILVKFNFRVFQLKQLHNFHSQTGDTTKLLFEVNKNSKIEACIIRFAVYNENETREGRSTVCISTQVGCRMACSFCATGTLGLMENLTTGNIVEQFVRANHVEIVRGRKIRNVVLMGMGEPLDNYDNVINSLKVLDLLAIASHRICLSTVGFSPKNIRRLQLDAPEISLALSLHAPNPALRSKIVVTANTTDFYEMLDAATDFVLNQICISRSKARRQKLLIEYCMLENVNDTPECAVELGELLSQYKDIVTVNLIPYNPTDVIINYKRPAIARVDRFYQILKREMGISAYVRGLHGDEIAAACGQLALKKEHDWCDKTLPEYDPYLAREKCKVVVPERYEEDSAKSYYTKKDQLPNDSSTTDSKISEKHTQTDTNYSDVEHIKMIDNEIFGTTKNEKIESFSFNINVINNMFSSINFRKVKEIIMQRSQSIEKKTVVAKENNTGTHCIQADTYHHNGLCGSIKHAGHQAFDLINHTVDLVSAKTAAAISFLPTRVLPEKAGCCLEKGLRKTVKGALYVAPIALGVYHVAKSRECPNRTCVRTTYKTVTRK